MSTHILSVTMKVDNSAWTGLQTITLDVEQLPETHPLIIELRKQWEVLEQQLLAKARNDPGDIFMLG